MKRTAEDYRRLLGEIDEDMGQLETLAAKVEKAKARIEVGTLDRNVDRAPGRLLPLARKMPALLSDFGPFHERYRTSLLSVARLLEEGD